MARVGTAAGGTRRVVLWVPDWPTTALVVDTPPGAPAATIHRGRVVVATVPARRRGVRSRMPVSTAQHLCPELVLLPRDDVREAAAFEPVARAFDGLAAGVVCLRPGLAWAPAAGPARWVGSEGALAGALVEAVTEATGAECQVGVASGMLAALEAARRGVVVAPADTPAFLSGLPVGRVGEVVPAALHDEVAHAVDVLSQLGVRTCEDLVGLGRGALLTRFGRAGEVVWTLCAGGDLAARGMRRARADVEVATSFDPPATEVDGMVMGLRRLAEDLAGELWRAGAASETLTVWMLTESGSRRDRTWTGLDCSDATDVVDRVRWQLRGWSDARGGAGQDAGAPDSGLEQVGLVARDLSGAPPGPRLWGRGDGDARAARAAMRLQSLLGEDEVRAPHLQGGHDPRSRVLEAPWGSPVEGLAPVDGEWEGGVDRAPATVLDRPCPVELWGVGPATPGGAEVWGTPGARDACPAGSGDGAPTVLGLAASDGDALPAPPSPRPVRVGVRGTLDVVPALLVPTPREGTGAPLGLEAADRVPVRVTGGPWAVLGRWWEGPRGQRAARAYLRLAWDGGSDLLLVQRGGGWSIDGVYD